MKLVFEGESWGVLVDQVRQWVGAVDRVDAGSTERLVSSIKVTPGGAPECPNGHGPMTYRPGGTAKAGDRIGQTYPPFYSCGTCKQTLEAS